MVYVEEISARSPIEWTCENGTEMIDWTLSTATQLLESCVPFDGCAL